MKLPRVGILGLARVLVRPVTQIAKELSRLNDNLERYLWEYPSISELRERVRQASASPSVETGPVVSEGELADREWKDFTERREL